MAYNGNRFLFTNIVPDSPVSENENQRPLTEAEQMQLLEENLQEYSEGWNPDYKLTYEKTQENGKDGYNIHLPYGIDFRIEHGNITFSKFGLSKDELKTVYAYLSQLGISGLSFDPQARDAAFERAAREAERELQNEDGAYEMDVVEGKTAEPTPEPEAREPANNNTPTNAPTNTPIMPPVAPSINSSDMKEEDILAARRQMAKVLKNTVRPVAKTENKKEEIHPCVEDINRYIGNHVKATHKDQSNNYRKIPIGNGYKLMWYKDADQKAEGPKADKTGKVSPNFDAGLKAEITTENGKPHLNVAILTPKYGDAADWVFDEALSLAAECKVTHLRFKAAAGFKGKFLNSCGKKMIVPVGVKLREKEFAVIMKAAKENNDDPKKRAEFYQRLAEQMENDLINMKDRSPNHPYVKMIKTLQIQIAVESSEDKYKRFNNFYEKNVLGKTYLDNSDTPVDSFDVKDAKDGPNAAKEMATGLAFVELMAEYIKNDSMKDMSDEELQKKYLDIYNKNLYLTHKNLAKKLDGVSSSKDMKEILNREYQKVQKNISAVRAKVAYEGFDKLTLPQMDKYTYYNVSASERNMTNRLRAGREVYLSERGSMPLPQREGRE